MKPKLKKALEILEIAIAAFLFFAMLINCGRYIDIRINGRGRTYSRMPEEHKRVLLSVAAGTLSGDSYDIITPVFAGFKTSVGLYAADYTAESRKAIYDVYSSYIPSLFSGTSQEQAFDSEEEKLEFIEDLKNSPSYILLAFYSDIPASVFLPATKGYNDRVAQKMLFDVKYLFICPYDGEKVRAVAINSQYDINVITPKENISFNSKELEAYNSSTGFSGFEFAKDAPIMPVFNMTLEASKYSLSTTAERFGKQTDSRWILSILRAFDVNINLAKTFVTRDGSVLNYVDGENELLFYQNGAAVYNTTQEGVALSELLGYETNEESYSFAEKIIAVKNLVGLIQSDAVGADAKLYVTDVYYTPSGNTISVLMKYFVNGICVTDSKYDASFVVGDTSLTYASFDALCCTKRDASSKLLPQKYAANLARENADFGYAQLLRDDENTSVNSVSWAFSLYDKAGQKEGAK